MPVRRCRGFGLSYAPDTNAGSTIGAARQAFATTATPAPVNAWTQLAPGSTFTTASIGSANSYGGISAGQLNQW